MRWFILINKKKIIFTITDGRFLLITSTCFIIISYHDSAGSMSLVSSSYRLNNQQYHEINCQVSVFLLTPLCSFQIVQVAKILGLMYLIWFSFTDELVLIWENYKIILILRWLHMWFVNLINNFIEIDTGTDWI